MADRWDVVSSGTSWLRRGRIPSWIVSVTRLGLTAEDPEGEVLRRQSLILMAVAIAVLAIGWVTAYALLGLYVSALIPFGYQVITTAGLILLARGWRFEAFRTMQLGLWLALPVLLQWSLGGFRPSSGVLLWSLTAPLGALVFTNRPGPWFLGYLGLTAVSGVLEPFLTPAPIPQPVNVTFFVLNVGAVSGVVYYMLRYFIRGLVAERQKSELLLLNVLPASVARRLKAGEAPLADRFEEAAILFADIVGFTPVSEQADADALVGFLDDLFTRFDALAERRGLEKIKTTGDAYIAVAGVPELGTAEVEALADAALEMRELVQSLRFPNGEPLRLRIGIDVGPVIGGVIGTHKFTYDLWGDTVNTASRMESSGVPGEIQVSERAFRRLADRYRFRSRGPVDVKGKGSIPTYLLTAREGPASRVVIAEEGG